MSEGCFDVTDFALFPGSLLHHDSCHEEVFHFPCDRERNCKRESIGGAFVDLRQVCENGSD